MTTLACVECGHKFRTIKAAERAAYGDAGCPDCGSSDIDLHVCHYKPECQAGKFCNGCCWCNLAHN